MTIKPKNSEVEPGLIRRGRDRIALLLGVKGPNGGVMITLANYLTIIRIIIVPLFLLFFFNISLKLQITSTFLFIVGAITDLWDGKLARRHGQVTPFGDFMDPLADKLLVLSGFWAILLREDFGPYFITTLIWVVLISIRETGLTILRINAFNGGKSITTSRWGKWKTGVEFTALISALVFLNARDILIYNGINWKVFSSGVLLPVYDLFFFICAVMSILSGVFYLRTIKTKQAG
jgi:CDP-diacylglycerol--glycerol-3-phosphate 3-phosphatidyltransferase